MVNRARRWVAVSVIALASAGTGLATPADAGDDYPGRTPPSLPNGRVEPKVLGRTEARSVSSDPIPITGGDVAGLAAMGAGAVALGAVLLRRGRRAPA